MRAAESPDLAAKGTRRTRARRARNGGFGVNERLTHRTPRQADDVAAGISRMLRGLSRRAEGGDLEALRCLQDLDRTIGLELLRAAHGLHVQHGYSWTEIGLACGVSRQAAHQRWGM